MDTNNVLIISYYFPPMGLSGVQRIMKFVKYLPEYNWSPFVLTSATNKYYAFDKELMKEIPSDGVRIYRTGKINESKLKVRSFPSNYIFQNFGRFFLSFFLQPDSKIFWKRKAIELGEKILKENKIDVIFATAPPFTDFLIAYDLSEKFKIPFVVDYRDIWVDNPYHFYPTFLHKNYARKLEEKILKKASRIIVTYRGCKEVLLSKYPFLRNDEITIIPHGFDEIDFQHFHNVKPIPKKFVVAHSGLFQDNRNPKYFLKAFSNFVRSKKDGIEKEAWFIGIMRKSHIRYIKKYDLEGNVKLFGYQPHSEVIRLLKMSNLLWLTFEDNVRSPGKLYEYFGARKPILICAPDGHMKTLAIQSNAAIAVDPRDVVGIQKALNTFYHLWQIDALPSPSEEFLSNFERKFLTKQLAYQLGLAYQI
ncbi:MAG: glycosyltransferase [Ignavibacteria bacterium]|nr:glycosyltransferase [Ignavibacteria bacterium]